MNSNDSCQAPDSGELETILDAFAGDIAKPPYYITGEWRQGADSINIYTQEAMDFCQTCADAFVLVISRRLQENATDDPPAAWRAESIENEGCRHCHWCGRLLDYTLLEYGADEEWDHFREHAPELPLGRETAFHIARLIEAKPDDPAVIELARETAALIETSA